ncbi:MAG: hypothetical protein FD151_1632, partial [bacterium]
AQQNNKLHVCTSNPSQKQVFSITKLDKFNRLYVLFCCASPQGTVKGYKKDKNARADQMIAGSARNKV